MKMKFDIVFENVMASLDASTERSLVSENVINPKSMAGYLTRLMQGHDEEAAAFLKQMIPFDDARAKFEAVAKNEYVDKHYDAAAKARFAQRTYWDMIDSMSDSSVIAQFMNYAKKLIETAADPEGPVFNGEPLEEIKDPKGGNITYKFHTEKGSVYIMSENHMSRRIKSEQGTRRYRTS